MEETIKTVCPKCGATGLKVFIVYDRRRNHDTTLCEDCHGCGYILSQVFTQRKVIKRIGRVFHHFTIGLPNGVMRLIGSPVSYKEFLNGKQPGSQNDLITRPWEYPKPSGAKKRS